MSREVSLRDPLARVRGLGSAKAGAQHWWTQRLTALALIPLTSWFIFFVLSLVQSDFAVAYTAVGQPVHAVLLIAFVVALFWHTALG